ncbi:MAG: IS200/IS605 family transposase [Ferruginibacter sp.]
MGTYKQIFYQIFLAPKNRESTISSNYEHELFKYIHGILKNKLCKLYRINGMEDHVHILSDLHPTICLSDYIKDIKLASNEWMKDSGRFPKFKGWQEGYGAFTYSVKERDMIINYIKNQKEHHKTENLFDEFRRLLIENGIEFDEKYLL